MAFGQSAGFVLAGGRSSRMGRDKALLMYKSSTLLGNAAGMVSQATGSVTIVGDPARYSGLGYPVIKDRVPDCGPLGGIHAALDHSQVDWNLVVACDMPGINVPSLVALLRQIERFPDAEVLLPESGGQTQPLCAIYHRRALPVIYEALLERRLKITSAIEPLRVIRVETGDEGLFHNVNTPEEWSAFTHSLR